MEATNIIIAVIGVLTLGVGALLWYAISQALPKFELLFDTVTEHEKEVFRLKRATEMMDSIQDQLITSVQKKEARIGQLEAAVFQAQLGERLAEAERLTNLVQVKSTENGQVVSFLQEDEPERRVYEIRANNFITE